MNSKDWFYKILKENPALTGVYPGIENEILEGAIDHHIHAYPDFVYRTQDMIEVSIDAVIREVTPLLIALLAVLAISTYWPGMVMFIPNLFRGIQ